MAPRPRDRAYGGAADFPRTRRINQLLRQVLAEEIERLADADERLRMVTVTEVNTLSDLRNATVFVEPLGGEQARVVTKALNRHHKFLRGRLGHAIEMKFTPALKFLHDESFDEAARISRLFDDHRVAQDLAPHAPSDAWKDED